MTDLSRRSLLQATAAFCGLSSLGAVAEKDAPEAQPLIAAPEVEMSGKKYNLILICLDTARRDRFTFYGYGRDTTPFLENLALSSMVYEQAYAPSNWTTPTHGSMFTGYYPSWHGAVSHKSMRLLGAMPTIQELLNRAGYQTINITGNKNVANVRVGRGFTEEHILLEQYPMPGLDKRAGIAYPLASSWLSGQRDPARPFFMYINNLEPHDRYDSLPDSWLNTWLREKGDIDKLREEWQARGVFNKRKRNTRYVEPYTEQDLERFSDCYDANIAYLDAVLEKFVNWLDFHSGLEMENTMLIVTSDHGELLGEHGFVTHHGGMYQELCHVPLLVRYPREMEQSGRASQPVSLVDLPSTIADLLGLEWEGKDALQGKSWLLPPQPDRPVFMEDGRPPYNSPYRPKNLKYHYMRAVLHQGKKYVWRDQGTEELFDVVEDPAEARNLIEERPRLAVELRNLMAGYFDKAPYGPSFSPDFAPNAEDQEALEALGYI